ncbi:TonB-dependent receptor [Cetobacterium sp.]|uniref:TonB-dependent receptor n=1 Tax=Cetobacterium sp. TaxID=2071632 RepID=UPI002FC880D6
MNKKHQCLLICCILSQITLANKNSVKLDNTVINSSSFGTKILETAKNTSVITSEEIEKMGYQSTEDALKSIPGVFYSTTGGKDHMPEVILRGQAPGKASQNILVLLNGTPLNSTTDTGGVNLGLIPIDDIERIEVTPNGGNVLYGEGASAGTISITTKNKNNKKYYGYVGFDGGSYNKRNYKIKLGTNITDKLSFNVAYQDDFLGGYRHHSEKDSRYFSTNATYDMNDGSLELGYLDSIVDAKFSGAVDKDDIKKANSNTEARETLQIFNGKMEKKITENLSLFLNGDYKQRKYKSQTSDRDTKSYYIKPELKYEYAKKSHLSLGGDFNKGESDYWSSSHSKNNFTNRNAEGIFAANSTQIGNFIFNQGYRIQKIDYDQKVRKGVGKDRDGNFKEDAYEISTSYLLTDDLSLYASYNHTFRAPTVDELGSWKGDPKTQTSDIFEVGTKGLINDFMYLSSAIYKSETNNEIFYLTADSGEVTGNYNFQNKIVRDGIEISLEQYFEKITLKQNFSFVNHKVDGGKYSGKKVPGVPEYLANLGISYKLVENLELSTTWFYYGSSYAQYDYENKYAKQGGHTEVNLNINYKYNPDLSLYTGINNLFDKEYFYAKAPTKKGDDVRYYYGNRRSVYAGFKYSF